MHLSVALTFSLLPIFAYSKTYSVNVGQNNLTFSPNNIKAAQGDKIEFHFFPKNHSVVASTFAKPCEPISGDGGVFSGFVPTAAESPKIFEFTVPSTDPFWFYCAQGKHCQSGMSMVVNEKSSGPNTLEAYQAAAKVLTDPSGVLPSIVGGSFIDAGSANGTSGGSASTSSTQGAASGTTSAAVANSSGSTGDAVKLLGGGIGPLLFAAIAVAGLMV